MPTLIFNKPYGVLSQFTDLAGRATLKAYIPVRGVYPAGRLDLRSEGLLVLTDDGRLQHRLTHPRFKLPKEYWVQVAGRPTDAHLRRLLQGVDLDGRPARAGRASLMPPPRLWPRTPPVREPETAWLRLVVHEGRKHLIRKMTAAVGLPTLRLVRWAVGPLTLHGLQPGQWRYLTPSEETRLRRLLGLPARRKHP